MPFVGDIINFIGACTRYVYGYTWRSLANKKKFTFKDYLYGLQDSDDWFDMTGHRFINIMVGLITIVGIIMLLKEIGL